MKPKIFTIPNFITLLNIACGCLALTSIFQGDRQSTLIFVILGGIFDFLDGMFARLLKSYSDTGKELDSLADMLTFGVVPGAVLFYLMEQVAMGQTLNFLPFILIVAFSGLRLAKFNVDTRQSTEFIGLPTPANALMICSLGFLSNWGDVQSWIAAITWTQTGIISLSVIMSLLLVCEIPMFSLKFKNLKIKDNSYRFLFIALTIILIIFLGISSVPLIIATYILMSIIKAVFKKLNKVKC